MPNLGRIRVSSAVTRAPPSARTELSIQQIFREHVLLNAFWRKMLSANNYVATELYVIM